VGSKVGSRTKYCHSELTIIVDIDIGKNPARVYADEFQLKCKLFHTFAFVFESLFCMLTATTASVST